MTPLPNTWPWHYNTSPPLKPPPTMPPVTPTCETSPKAAPPFTGKPPVGQIGSHSSATSPTTYSIIRRTVHALWSPDRQGYLLTLRDGLPLFTESAVQACTWFTEDGARRIAQLIHEPLMLVPINYVRPAADPLGWEVADG